MKSSPQIYNKTRRLSRFFRNFYPAGLQRDADCGLTIRGGIVKLADGIWRDLSPKPQHPTSTHIQMRTQAIPKSKGLGVLGDYLDDHRQLLSGKKAIATN